MNFFGDNNYIWLIIILLCCCGNNGCLCDILPLLLLLECFGGDGGRCGGNKFGGCGCK